MRLLIILIFIISINTYSHEFHCTEDTCSQSTEVLTEYQRRQLEKKILQTMTLVLDRLQQKILLEITK